MERERGETRRVEDKKSKKKKTPFRRSSHGFVGYTINPVRWWRLADWWFNIPSHALYCTYNGPDVTMETKHPSQKDCSLNFKESQDTDVRLKLCETSAKAHMTCLNSAQHGNVSIWSFLWRRVNLALERLVLCESHNPCRENECECGRAESIGEQGCKQKETERESDRGRERGSLAAYAWSRLLFSVMAQNDISMIRKNKPTK